MTRSRRAFRWLFEDRHTGRIVVAQTPNATMWVVLAALVLSFFVEDGRAVTATRVVLFLALAFWAFDEIARGVKPWRRILGIGTLVGMFLCLVILSR